MSPRLAELLLSSQSDERLVDLARTGHRRAFAVIVDRYRGELEAFARGRSSDGRAEDIVQQAFLAALAALQAGAEVRHLRGWLYQIVRNEASKARPVSDLPLDEVAVAGEPLEELVARRETARSALSELSGLPTRQREALVAMALHGATRADVAETMGLSEGAVRQLVHRARATLRTVVTALTPYPLAQAFAGSGAGVASDASITAGAASAGGAAAKLGALIASSVVATSVATLDLTHRSHHRPPGSAKVTKRDSDSRGRQLAAAASRASDDRLGETPGGSEGDGPGGTSDRDGRDADDSGSGRSGGGHDDGRDGGSSSGRDGESGSSRGGPPESRGRSGSGGGGGSGTSSSGAQPQSGGGDGGRSGSEGGSGGPDPSAGSGPSGSSGSGGSSGPGGSSGSGGGGSPGGPGPSSGGSGSGSSSGSGSGSSSGSSDGGGSTHGGGSTDGGSGGSAPTQMTVAAATSAVAATSTTDGSTTDGSTTDGSTDHSGTDGGGPDTTEGG